MHHGVYIGKYAKDRSKKILILGESHHINKSDNSVAGVPANYTSASVVEEYLIKAKCGKVTNSLQFFSKIAESFGFDSEREEERLEFWKSVYFGNYVDVLCGIGDDKAEKQISKNKKSYNDELFQFINENGIDIVCCFGRRVFNALPSLTNKSLEEQGRICKDIYIGKTNDFIELCTYLPNVCHRGTSVELKKSVMVYSFRHPSARGGYRAENYVDVLNKVWKEV